MKRVFISRQISHGGWMNSSGASAVEFALVAPVLIALLFGIVAFGSALGFAHSLQTAASEGARAAIAGLDPDERAALATSAVRNNLAANVLLNPRAVSVSAGPDAVDGDIFTVTLRYDTSGGILGMLSRLLPVPISIVRTASIRRGGL